MKKVKVLTLILALVLAISLSGCSKEEKAVEEEVKTDEQIVAEKIESITAQAKKDVEEAEAITKEDIHEAIDFIKENVGTPISEATDEVKEKLVYYGSYLKAVGEKAGVETEHTIVKLGDDVYTYTTKEMTKVEDEASEVSKEVKADIDKGLETLKEDKDKLVDDLHSLYEKAKEKL